MKVLELIAGAGALMTPEITRLRNAVDDDLAHKYNSVNGIKDELVALTDEVSNIQSWVEKLEQIIWPHKEMLDWSRRAAEIQCEVDHYISEFLCEQNSCARDFIVRHRLVTHVKGLKRRLKVLADKYRSSSWDQLATSNMMYGLGCRASCILIQDHEDLFGFQGQLGDLVNLLQPEKNDSLKVISVVGSGGSGKTTLALEAFGSVGSKYDCRASICVSGCLDTTGLLMDICVQFGNMDPSTGQLQSNHLIRKVADFLATKRYLILLDDLSRTEMWETLKLAFPKNKLGSRIVLTSRLNSVALICSRREELVLRMSPLNDDDSRRLFLDSIYGTSDVLLNLKEIWELY
ncbi:hypothetical protein BS78_04G031500 [Paspalum vaginatum]|nr:hypothetical protein BS78_04G031500 [Paspalum vaginatum]